MHSLVLAQLLRDNPIVITGMGAFSAAGDSVATLWQAALTGQSLAAWREFKLGDAKQRFAVCHAPELDASRPELHPVRKMDRCVQMALLAANRAWSQAGLPGAYPAECIGLMVGSSRGPFSKSNESPDLSSCRQYPPSLSASSTFASLSGALAQTFKLKGPGATPALEAILCIEALRQQAIPPTANCNQPDPLCPINAQPLACQPERIATVMSNSLGFWGYHASLIFSEAS